MMNGEETDGGISLGDMEKALVCLLMTSMEAPVQAESAGLTQEMFADASLGFVYEVIMKIYATGVRPDMVLVERGMREADEELAAKLGGLSFLLPYMLNVRHDGNVAAYVEGIKKQYKLRCLVTLFGTMAFKAGKVSSVPEELVDEAERLLMQFRQKTAERREDGGDVADGPERGACREIGLLLQPGDVEPANVEPCAGRDDGREPGSPAHQQADRTRVGTVGRGCPPVEGLAFLSRLYGRGYRRADTGESAAAMPPGKMRPGGRGLPAPSRRRPPEGGDTGTDGGTECKGVEATGVGQQLSGADGFADESCLRGACRQSVSAGDERPARFGDDRAGGGLRGVHLPSRTLWLHPRRKDGA